MVLDSDVSHALLAFNEVFAVLAELTISMQKVLLAENVVWRDVFVSQIGMRLRELHRVPILIQLILAVSEQIVILRNIYKLHVCSKLLGSLPVLVVVSKVEKQLDYSLFSQGSCSVSVDEKHQKMLVEAAIISIERTIQLRSVQDSVIVEVEQHVFKLEPGEEFHILDCFRVLIKIHNARLAERNDSEWNLPLLFGSS